MKVAAAAHAAMEAAKGAMESAHSGAAHAAVESIHAMEAASEAVAHEGLADEAAMANEAGLTDEAVAHDRTANDASIDEAVVDEAVVDEKAMMEVVAVSCGRTQTDRSRLLLFDRARGGVDAFRPAGIDVQRTEIATVDVAFGGKIAGRSA